MEHNRHDAPPLALLTFSGADAASFLQGQLTTNATKMRAGEWRRAAYCSRQGRVLACGILARPPATDDVFWFIARDDLAATTAALLQKFVLRAKVKVATPPTRFSAATAALMPAPAGDMRMINGVATLNEGDSPHLYVAPDSAAAAALPAPDGNWLANEILRGVPWIGAAVADQFIPQFINWELLDGVDFDKGCYVGQEVITRLHHLGVVKRRGLILRTNTELAAGETVADADGKTAGAIACAATTDDGGGIAFAVILKCAAKQPLFVNGAAATVSSPPYHLRENEKFKRN